MHTAITIELYLTRSQYDDYAIAISAVSDTYELLLGYCLLIDVSHSF